MAETKEQKLARIPSGASANIPLPEWPKLPESFYKRHPEDKEALDRYQAQCQEFFKKAASRAS